MPTKIELLRQAGFSTEQIVDWAYQERLRLRAQGTDDESIDRDFGVTRPPEPASAPFLQRLKNGLVLQRMMDAAKDHWDSSVGEHPLDSALDHWSFLQRYGEAGKLAATAATDLELASKGVSGALGGLGAAVGQGLEEAFGPGNRPKGTAARDAALMAEILPMFSAATAPARVASLGAPLRAAGSQIGKAVPKVKDFQAAAASIAGNPGSLEIEQQLLELWKELGVHPSDIAGEVSRNPTLAHAIKASSTDSASPTRAAALPDPRQQATRMAAANARQAEELEGVKPPEIAAASAAGHESSGDGAASNWPAVPHDDHSMAFTAAHAADRTEHNVTLNITDPPLLEQRPFPLDYPMRPPKDAPLRLSKDIEGRELRAQFIAGRRTWGGADEGLTAKDINQVIRALAIRFKIMEFKDKDVGGRYFRVGTNRDNSFQHIQVSRELTARERDLAKAHELGHALDDFIGWASEKLVPDSKEMNQLRMVYGKTRQGDPSVWFTRQPEYYRYKAEEVKKELFADGFRAYLGHPNFFKRVAPDAARMIRALVNEHPVLSKVIQFNSVAGAGLLGARPDQDDGDQ